MSIFMFRDCAFIGITRRNAARSAEVREGSSRSHESAELRRARGEGAVGLQAGRYSAAMELY